jgi:hypothetical protein
MWYPITLDEVLGSHARTTLRVPTTWERTVEVLAEKAPSPLYAAVIECVPAASELTESDARPLASATLPITVAPSRNWTLPVGVPPAADTVAVNVTA